MVVSSKIKKLLIAVDKFKGTFTSLEAGKIIADSLKENFNIEIVPLADGGDGTLDALNYAFKGKIYRASVRDPLGRIVKAKYVIAKDTAIIEMANASGLNLLQKSEMDPMKTTSYGLGELIKEAINKNVNRILIGLGGSATNDAGAGMLQALGVKFLDKNGQTLIDKKGIGFGGYFLKEIRSFDVSQLDKRVFKTNIQILSDVKNSLTGRNGTSLNYSYQKGADESIALELEKGVKIFKKAVIRQYRIDPDFPGSGAAGGIAAAIFIFLKGKIINGFDSVAEILELEKKIKNSDLLITGEGSIDYQSAFGKAPIGAALLAKKYDKNVIAIAGKTGEGAEKVFRKGIDVIIRCFDDPVITETMLKKLSEERLMITAKAINTVAKDIKYFKNKIISHAESKDLYNTQYSGKRNKHAEEKRL